MRMQSRGSFEMLSAAQKANCNADAERRDFTECRALLLNSVCHCRVFHPLAFYNIPHSNQLTFQKYCKTKQKKHLYCSILCCYGTMDFNSPSALPIVPQSLSLLPLQVRILLYIVSLITQKKNTRRHPSRLFLHILQHAMVT